MHVTIYNYRLLTIVLPTNQIISSCYLGHMGASKPFFDPTLVEILVPEALTQSLCDENGLSDKLLCDILIGCFTYSNTEITNTRKHFEIPYWQYLRSWGIGGYMQMVLFPSPA